jgi:hypothetical protein
MTILTMLHVNDNEDYVLEGQPGLYKIWPHCQWTDKELSAHTRGDSDSRWGYLCILSVNIISGLLSLLLDLQNTL